MARQRLIAEGLRPDREQATVASRKRRHRRIDIAFSAERIGIECIGWRYHSTRTQFDEDARRWNEVAEEGRWRILHLTWTMLFDDWQTFVDQLRLCLAGRPAPGVK